MTKLIYLLWPRAAMAPAERRRILLEDCAPKLLAAGAAGLQVNIADDGVTTPSPAPKPLFKKIFVAQVNLWLEGPARRTAAEDILRGAGFDIAGYRVDEWLYTDYGENPHAQPRDWPDGERSPGVLAVTLLYRPRGIPKDEWMRRWFGWQSPMSEWMQPRARYVRNLVEEALTPAAPACAGIVEEAWPSGEHVTNPYLFYGARSPLELIRHMGIMLRSVTRMLRLWNIMTVMMSEYFIRTPRAGT
jgi:hypothetical protein